MIIWIERPSAYRYVAVGKKNLLNPVNPACPMKSFYPISSGLKKENKDRIQSLLSVLVEKKIAENMLPKL